MEIEINIRMARISEKLVTIRAIAERKREVYNKIHQTMIRKATLKEKMTAKQITEYQRFATFYDSEVDALNRQIDELGVVLKHSQKQADIYANLKLIDQKQSGVISGLESVVKMGQRTLAIL